MAEAEQGKADVGALVKRLRQQFGRHLDAGVLEAVLEMHGNDYTQAEAFLAAENRAEGVDLQNFNPGRAQNEDEGLPPGYFDPPEGFEGAPAAAAAAQDQTTAQGGGGAVPMEAEAGEEARIKGLRDLFTRQSTFQDHLQAQEGSMLLYFATLLTLVRAGMEVKDSAKARALAALWARKRFTVAAYLLSPRANGGRGFGFGLTEVLKAANLLDTGRRIRVLEKRHALLQRQKNVRQKTLGKVVSSLNDLRREPVAGSLSGHVARHIARWVSTLGREELQFYATHLPKEPWKELADLLHLNPAAFAEPWFLPVAFGAPAPEGSIVSDLASLTPQQALEVVRRHAPPYTVLRKHREHLAPEVMVEVARYTPLDTLLWWYEEMRGGGEVDAIIADKLRAGEPLSMGYGKLMERLLTLKGLDVPFFRELIAPAEAKLRSLSLPLEPPVVCFGDASYSMDVAIRVSTIIASLMTAVTNADLRFFNTETIVPPKAPRTIEDVLDLTVSVRADKLTAPAAALREYYDAAIPVKTFIVVTDEVENLPAAEGGGDYFAQLFFKYRQRVEPASELVFVSFLPSQNSRGRMVRALERFGIRPRLEMKLDGARPDLTKLDSMLALLSSNSAQFHRLVTDAAASVVLSQWELDPLAAEAAMAS